MRAIDTNVVVRFLTADDEEQFQRARTLFETAEILLLTSVLLETEWVLRSNFGYSADIVVAALRAVATHDAVRLEDPARIVRALDLAERGVDFADALHLAGSVGCADFVSFDRPLARKASALGATPVVEP